MILLVAIVLGGFIGLLSTWKTKTPWQPPAIKSGWLILAGFAPQFLAIYFPLTRDRFSDGLASLSLVISQIILLVFCVLNRQQLSLLVLAAGLAINLTAILVNKGFMPLPVETAAQLLPLQRLNQLEIGQRLGAGSKDILLPMDQIRFAWLADRFYPPKSFPYKFAFSLGDVLIAAGAFWLLAKPTRIMKTP